MLIYCTLYGLVVLSLFYAYYKIKKKEKGYLLAMLNSIYPLDTINLEGPGMT